MFFGGSIDYRLSYLKVLNLKLVCRGKKNFFGIGLEMWFGNRFWNRDNVGF